MLAAVSVIIILVAIAAVSINVVTTMRDAANDIDARRSVSAVASAVSSIKKRLASTVRDNAVWDDAYAAVGSENGNEWIKSNWGTTSADYPLYDGIIVLDPDGKQIAAYHKGEEFDALSAFEPLLLPQAQAVAHAPATKAHVSFSKLSGEVTMVATLAIQPYSTKPSHTTFYTLTFFKSLTKDYVRNIADDFQVRELALGDEKVADQLSYQLADSTGQHVGYLNWPRMNPGTAVYSGVFPQLLALAGLFLLFLAVVIIFSRLELRKETARAAAAGYEATHDNLTGLLNRSGLIQSISVASPGSFIHLIDLDGFKAVNDAWGHAVGDRLIDMVANRLQTVAPQVFSVARIGGDEFAFIHPADVSAMVVGTRVAQLLKEPFLIDGRTVEIGASIGFVERMPELSALELLRRADVALYHAKENGRGQVRPYSFELDRERENVADAEQRLKAAISNEEIKVVYQPLMSATDGKVVGVEALARWTPPTGPVSPEVFIPLAERSGLIEQLSKKVIETAMRAVCQWPDIDLSVNISPVQLCNPNFADDIRRTLVAEKFDPSRLILEVTEGIFISKPDRARRSITALHQIGVRFAMDDFGTGHASIGTLRQFGFDKVKIDRSLFTAGNDAVVKATIQLAAALDIPVTAEGIETEMQASFAREAGCELLQGYLIGKPMSLDQLSERLEGPLSAAVSA